MLLEPLTDIMNSKRENKTKWRKKDGNESSMNKKKSKIGLNKNRKSIKDGRMTLEIALNFSLWNWHFWATQLCGFWFAQLNGCN